MRDSTKNRLCGRLLLAMLLVCAIPYLLRGLPSGTASLRVAAQYAASSNATVGHVDGALPDVLLTPFHSGFSASKLRGGRSTIPPIFREAPLPAYASIASSHQSSVLSPPSDQLPPSARPLLVSVPSRAPPIA